MTDYGKGAGLFTSSSRHQGEREQCIQREMGEMT